MDCGIEATEADPACMAVLCSSTRRGPQEPGHSGNPSHARRTCTWPEHRRHEPEKGVAACEEKLKSVGRVGFVWGGEGGGWAGVGGRGKALLIRTIKQHFVGTQVGRSQRTHVSRTYCR